MTTQREAIVVRTTITTANSVFESVEWDEYPTLGEALDTLSNLACYALRAYGTSAVTLTDPERVSYVKPNGTRVVACIEHDLTEYSAP